MRIDDLHLLPHVSHSASFLYLEYGRLEQDDRAAAFVDKRGRVSIPLANLSLLMLGPGTTATHRAICNAAECGCLVVWAGEQGVRLYASGLGDTRSARNMLRQASCTRMSIGTSPLSVGCTRCASPSRSKMTSPCSRSVATKASVSVSVTVV